MINSLSAQHGSSVRLHLIAKHLKKHCATLTLVESNASLVHRLFYFVHCCFKKKYTVLFVQKFNPLTLVCIAIARFQGKYVWADWDDFDYDMQRNLVLKYCINLCERLGPKLCHTVSSHSYIILNQVPKHKQYFLAQTLDDDFRTAKKSEKKDFSLIQQSQGISSKTKLIGYMCTLTHGGMLDLKNILKVWQSMLAGHQDLYFILLAGGPLHHHAKQFIDQYQLSRHVYLTGFLKRDQILQYLTQLDLAHIYMSERPANQVRVSLKLCEYLALGLPVIGQCLGETQHQLGKWVYSSRLESMAETSINFLKHPNTFPQLPPFVWPNTAQTIAKLAETLKKAYMSYHA